MHARAKRWDHIITNINCTVTFLLKLLISLQFQESILCSLDEQQDYAPLTIIVEAA